jgi:hypothetical protein
LAQAQSEKNAELEASYVTAHATGFISSASGTSIVYGFYTNAQQDMEK